MDYFNPNWIKIIHFGLKIDVFNTEIQVKKNYFHLTLKFWIKNHFKIIKKNVCVLRIF